MRPSEFGMLARGSDHVGTFSVDRIWELLAHAPADDPAASFGRPVLTALE